MGYDDEINIIATEAPKTEIQQTTDEWKTIGSWMTSTVATEIATTNEITTMSLTEPRQRGYIYTDEYIEYLKQKAEMQQLQTTTNPELTTEEFTSTATTTTAKVVKINFELKNYKFYF